MLVQKKGQKVSLLRGVSSVKESPYLKVGNLNFVCRSLHTKYLCMQPSTLFFVLSQSLSSIFAY